MSETAIRTAGIYIPLFTGSLSMLGSGAIIYSIWAQFETKMKDPQHRILGMMSICDFVYSANKALGFLTYPSGYGVPTFGNQATCSMQGFFTQFGYAAGCYSPFLSLYYYLTINRGMNNKEFARIEKVLHVSIVGLHLTFAIVGVSIGLFDRTPSFCYIARGSDGSFQNTAPIFYEAFAQIWIQLAYVIVIVTNTSIWLHVRKQENKMKKYQVNLPSSHWVSDSQLANMRKKTSHSRSVFIQSSLYIGAFMLSWSWATIYHIIAWLTGKQTPWATLLINTFLPLQGFWNAFIYSRHRYLRAKKRNKDLGCFEVLKLVFLPRAADHGDSTNEIVPQRSIYRSIQRRASKWFRAGGGEQSVVELEAGVNDTNDNTGT